MTEKRQPDAPCSEIRQTSSGRAWWCWALWQMGGWGHTSLAALTGRTRRVVLGCAFLFLGAFAFFLEGLRAGVSSLAATSAGAGLWPLLRLLQTLLRLRGT